MREALIVSAVRTPVGRAGGALADVRADDLAAVAVRGAVDRVSFDPARLDDVILGCTNQAGEDNRNVARMAALLAGFPVDVPGQTVNRLCGSGLQAIASAAQAIKAGEGDAFVAGGVESMTRAPYVMLKSGEPWNRQAPPIADSTVGWRFVNPKMKSEWTISLGMTAEKVAKQYGITREEQDAFALESQRRAACAIREGMFNDEIVPVEMSRGKAAPVIVSQDEHPRPGCIGRQARRAEAGVRGRRQRDGRQCQRHQRRRIRAAARRRRRRGRPDAARAHRRVGCCRRRSIDDGHRPGSRQCARR